MKTILAFILSLLLFSCNSIEIKKEFYPDGKLRKETTLKNGKPFGVSKEYLEDGKICIKKHWTDGELDSTFYYFDGDHADLLTISKHEKTVRVYLVTDSGAYILVDSTRAATYMYPENYTLTIGQPSKFHFYIFSANTVAINKCKLYIGAIDTLTYMESDIEKAANKEITLAEGYGEYSFTPNQVGNNCLVGVFKFEHPDNKIANYPFSVSFVVKAK